MARRSTARRPAAHLAASPDDEDRRRPLRRHAHRATPVVADRAPTIREVAQVAGISPFHFIRLFAAVFGATPHQLRIAARLDRAKQLLALGACSVTEVCLEVGFDSLGSFSTLFRRRIGESPSGYQRRMRVLVTVPGTLPVVAFPGCLSLMRHLPASAFRSSREA